MTDSSTPVRSVYIWVTEGTWRASVDAARDLAPAGARFTLLHVTPAAVTDAARGAYLGMFGRGWARPRGQGGGAGRGIGGGPARRGRGPARVPL